MADVRAGAKLRAEAAKAVDAVVTSGRSLDDALKAVEDRVKPADLPLIRMLSYGSLRHHWRLRAAVRKLLNRPLKARDSVIETLLAIGVFQLSDTRVPDHAAVSMTVEAVRLLRRPKYAGLVNAVLRNYLRQSGSGSAVGADEHDVEARYDHPSWLLEMLERDWPDKWREIVAANNERAPMWLRVNRRRLSVDAYSERLAEAGLEHRRHPGIEHAICLEGAVPVSDLPGFADGDVSVQDGAAQIAAAWLLADGGSAILDACAAPGGKTAQLLELAAADAHVTAVDVDEQRLDRVRENLARLGLTATVLAADASLPKRWWDGALFDRILVDAPCSASGVIRRHPDIKLTRRVEDIAALAARQAAMLDALWPLLAPGGRLLYVTCSVLAAENELLIGEFLERNRDAQESKLLPNYKILDLMVPKTHGFQILPGTGGLDGFYYASLERTNGQT